MKKINHKAAFAAFIWIVAEAIFQIHGVVFWGENGGTQGWIWSPVLGVITLWFWLHESRWIRYLMGTVASILLLIGPLYQIGAPLVGISAQREAYEAAVAYKLSALRSTETELIAAQETFLENSKDRLRSGWSREHTAVRNELARVRADIAGTMAEQPPQHVSWLSDLVIGIQLFTTIVLQIAAIAALCIVRKGFYTVDEAPAVVAEQCPDEMGVSQRSAALGTLETPVVAERMEAQTDPVVASPEAVAEPPAPKIKTRRRGRAGNASAGEIAVRIAAGDHGASPGVRAVMAAENVRHSTVKNAFGMLIESGVLLRSKSKFALALQGE